MNFHTVLIAFGSFFIGVYTDRDPWSILRLKYKWRFLEYDFDSIYQEVGYINNGGYNVVKNLPIDVESARDGRIFMTVRRTQGAPASLVTIGDYKLYGGGPMLRPYPDWNWTDTNDCNNIISVHRITQDQCNRLWVLDSGNVDDVMVCTPKLLAFDLATDKLVKRVDIPPTSGANENGTSLLVTPIVDIFETDCAKTNIYMADVYNGELIIWDGENLKRFQSPYFKPDPIALRFSAAGITFKHSGGLLALSITPDVQKPSDRLLFFRPISSYNMSYTNVVDLISSADNQSSIEYFSEPTELSSQSLAQAFTSKGILFFSGTSEMSLLCWNRNKPFKPKNIVTVAQDDQTLQWATSIKIYMEDSVETLWVLTNRGQQYFTNKMNFGDVNFRIFVGNVDDLVRGTNCQ